MRQSLSDSNHPDQLRAPRILRPRHQKCILKAMRPLKRGWLLLFACLVVSALIAASAVSAPVFEMRLVVADGPQTAPPQAAERMELPVTNSATRQITRQIFWISKTVLMDQNDLQTSTVVTSSPATSNVPGRPEIEVIFTPKGRTRLTEITRHNLNKRLAIIIDGRLMSAPVIKSEISGGKAMISGDFTAQEATALSNLINSALNK